MNEIQLGDCIEIIKQFPDNYCDMILTDIPYGISRENNFKTMKDRKGRNGISFGEWDLSFNVSCLANFPRLIKSTGCLLIFHAFEQYSDVLSCLKSNGMQIKDKLIWEKTNPMPRNRDRRYVANIEMASWYVKDSWIFNRQNNTYDASIMRYPSESGGGFKRYHPNQKNLKMLEEIIKRHTNENDLIVDPFMGSGSTCIACINTKRRYLGIESNPVYFEIAKDRLNLFYKDSIHE